MDKETIHYIITGFHERDLPRTISRDLRVPLDTDKVVILTGIRRSGKTFILYDTIQKLCAANVDKRNILYINFADDRLFPLRLDDMDVILKAYYELYPEKTDEKKYIFFDEIQTVPHWEKYIRRIHDTENLQIFITGSSSKLLSKEISTALRGRGISYEVFPLSFPEYLRFRGIEYTPYSVKSESQIAHEFQRYMKIGGFPEIVIAQEEIRQKILQEYADMILYKDLLEHYGIQHKYLLKYLIKLCFSQPGTQFSINKVYNSLKSQNVDIAKNTVYEYMEYLQDSFVAFFVRKYSTSLRKQEQYLKKLFVIDNGLVHSYTMNPSPDWGKRLENILFLHFRSKNQPVFFYKNKTEIDFVLETKQKFLMINAAHTISNEHTAQREIKSLFNGIKHFPHSDMLIIANDWDKNLIDKTVPITAAWKYLLQ